MKLWSWLVVVLLASCSSGQNGGSGPTSSWNVQGQSTLPRQGGSWGGGWREQDWYTGRMTVMLIALLSGILIGTLVVMITKQARYLTALIAVAITAGCAKDTPSGGGGRPIDTLNRWYDTYHGDPGHFMIGVVIGGIAMVVTWAYAHHARLATLRSTRNVPL